MVNITVEQWRKLYREVEWLPSRDRVRFIEGYFTIDEDERLFLVSIELTNGSFVHRKVTLPESEIVNRFCNPTLETAKLQVNPATSEATITLTSVGQPFTVLFDLLLNSEAY